MDAYWSEEESQPKKPKPRRGRWVLMLLVVLLFAALGVYTFGSAEQLDQARALLAENNPADSVRNAVSTLVPTPKAGTLLAAASAEPTPTPAAKPSEPQVVVANTGGDGVALRKTAGAAERLAAWAEGARMTLVGPDQEAAGRVWRNVRDAAGNVGWVPAEYLAAATGGAAATTPGRAASSATAAPVRPEAVQTANRSLLVGEVQFVGQIGNSKPEQGGEFAVVAVTIRNVGEKRESYAPADFWLQNSQGNIAAAKVVAGVANPLERGQLAPGGWVSGRLVFEVPKGDRELILIWAPCPESCEERQVKLP